MDRAPRSGSGRPKGGQHRHSAIDLPWRNRARRERRTRHRPEAPRWGATRSGHQIAMPHESQERRILNLLHAAWPGEVPALALSRISLQYSARIFSLRRKSGWKITNRVETRDGVKYGYFRLGEKPTPASRELRIKQEEQKSEPAQTQTRIHGLLGRPRLTCGEVTAPIGAQSTLFGDISPERYPD